MSKLVSKVRSDRRRLGWLAAGVLLLIFSSSVWALDFNHEIQKQETDAAQILGTLGRDKRPVRETASQSSKDVQVKTIPAAKGQRKS